MTLSRPSKIRDISVSLTGTARTDWPEGIGPNRLELSEETEIIRLVETMFNAKRERARTAATQACSVRPASRETQRDEPMCMKKRIEKLNKGWAGGVSSIHQLLHTGFYCPTKGCNAFATLPKA